jgi:hypothetical protein
VQPPPPVKPPSYLSLPLSEGGLPSGVTIGADGLWKAPVSAVSLPRCFGDTTTQLSMYSFSGSDINDYLWKGRLKAA